MIGRFSNPGFYEKWAFKKYSLKNAVLYITGSSSALLSRGIGTALTGRYLDIEVFPLNLKEFLHFNQVTIKNISERIRHRNKLRNGVYVQVLFKEIKISFEKITKRQEIRKKLQLH